MSDEVGYSPEGTPPDPQEPGRAPQEATPRQRPKLLGGITGKGFMPGHSGNPSGLPGRPPGIVALVRSKTKDGATIVKFMNRVLKGKPVKKATVIDQDTQKVTIIKAHPTVPDRIDAAKWLADRGWGKVKEVAEEGQKRPFLVVLQGDKIEDPLDEPESQGQGTEPARPALPLPMPEVGFDLNLRDVEEKP